MLHRSLVIMVALFLLVAATALAGDPVRMTIREQAVELYDEGSSVRIVVDGVTWTYRGGQFYGPASGEHFGVVMEAVAQWQERRPRPWPGPYLLHGLFLIAVGSYNLWRPERVWHWRYRWKDQYAEPSSLALDLIQVSGLVGVIGGIILLLQR